MYAREIDGQEYTFGVSGKLIRNVLVMYDRQTQTLWSQLIGEAIEGPLIGTKLEFLPSWMTTWESWRTQHPNTLALDKGYAGARDPYERGYYGSSQAGVIGETFFDDRLYTKEFVVGVELNDAAVAYPFSQLNITPVVNDARSDQNLLIAFETGGGSAFVFDRQVGDQVLTFEATGEPFAVTDLETGSRWDLLTGQATAGTLAGETLTPVKSTTSFWFGWKDFHPDTEIYFAEETSN